MGFATGQLLRNTTRAKLACLLLLVTWTYTFWPTLHPMLHAYWSSGFDYQGLLIMPLVAILIKYNIAKNSRATLVYNSYGLLVLLLFSGLWVFAAITKLQLLQQVAILAMIPAIILTTSGFKILRAIFLPILCLFLLVPYGENLFLHTQQLFAAALVKLLAQTNVPVYWEGGTVNVLQQEYQISSIIYALKFSTLYLTFGLAFAVLTQKKLYKGILIASTFIILPVTFLLLTVYGIINISMLFNLQAISNDSFRLLSCLITGIALICATTWGILAIKKQPRPTHDGIDWRSDYSLTKSHWLLPTLLACSMLLALPKIAANLYLQSTYKPHKQLSEVPQKIKNWNGPTAINQHETKTSAQYQKQERMVKLTIDGTNKKDYTTIPAVGPTIKNKQFKLKINNHLIPVSETIATVNNYSNIIWSFNYINGHLTTSPLKTQVLENLYSLTKKGVETGTIRISTRSAPNLNAARNSLREFMAHLVESPPTWLK